MGKLHALLAFAAIVVSSAAISAETYGSINVPPGVYFGAGNPNGNFNISTGNNLELALRAKNRTPVGPVLIDGSTGVYSVPAGFCNVGCGTPKAKWNYEFSIHTLDGSALTGYSFLLGVDHDATAGTNFYYVDPLSYWPDNATDGLAGVQNSENFTFGNTPGGAINANATGLYDFILLAFNSRQELIGQVDMTVQVPEPGSLALLGLGLAGLAAVGRRKLKS